MTTRWKLEKMYTRLRASEASEPIFLYLRWKHTILLKSQYIQNYTLLINHCLSVQYVHDCVRNTHDMVLFIRNKKLEKNDIERAERASQNICTFASEKCFTYRPETREKAINDCDLRASHFLCVSETCDSSQCVGESHSLSVQCVLLFVTLVMCMVIFCYWVLWHWDMSFGTIFGGFGGAFCTQRCHFSGNFLKSGNFR